MNKPSKWSALLCAASLLLVVSGCSDDDDPIGNTIDPVAATAAAQAAVTGIVVPTMTIFSVLAQLAIVPAQGGGGLGGNCSGGGTYSISETDITFTQCSEGGNVINGTVMITNPETGALAWNLTIDGNTVGGDGTLAPFVNCGPALTFGNFSIMEGDVATDVAGALEQCEGSYPEGALTLTISGPAFDLLISLLFDGSAVFGGTVTDLSTGEVAATCTGDLDVPSVDCV